MQDLANELNTTTATISRALNNSPEIGEAMKKKVRDLAQKYNFRPNAHASSLRRGKAKTIGIIVPFINRHFFSNIIHQIEKQVSNQGYNVMILQTEDSFKKEKEDLALLIDQRVSGIIISLSKPTTHCRHLKKAIAEGIKVVQIDNVLKDTETSYIKTKDREGARITTKHLLEQGYRHIALLNGEMTSKIYQDRKQGFIDAHKEAGLPYNEDLFINNTNNRQEGRAAMEKLLASGLPIDAVFSSGDYAALGAYLVCKERGIAIPEQIGIAGFANEHFAELVTPSITSSDQHSEKIGALAAQQILEEINNHEAPLLKTSLLPELIVRESTLKKGV